MNAPTKRPAPEPPPRIGISAALWAEREEWTADHRKAYSRAKQEYVRLVEDRGGAPLVLPIVERLPLALAMLAVLDGLLLSGGDDVDPSHYGEPDRFPDSIIHPTRDRFEIALIREAMRIDLPVFGICRGLQVLNVALGGTLHQDGSLRPETLPHKAARAGEYLYHPVIPVQGTLFRDRIMPKETVVNSRHHQHVKDLAGSLRASAHAPDGIVEAAEWTDDSRYVMAVQWHPESEPDSPLTDALLDDFLRAAKNRRLPADPGSD